MDFPGLLKRQLKERGLTQKAFATQTGRAEGFISDVLHGRNGPSDDLKSWAAVLKLEGEAKTEFLLAGALARSPKLVRDHVARLERQVKATQSGKAPKAPKPTPKP
jgi:transcriptional regulator with XRE-family HTH domain